MGSLALMVEKIFTKICSAVHYFLTDFSHVMNTGQETTQHLSCNLIFVVGDKVTQIKDFFCRKLQTSSCALNLD